MGLLTTQDFQNNGNSISQFDIAYAALNASTEKIVVVISTRQYDASTTPDLVSVTFDQGGNNESLTFITGARAYETFTGDRHFGTEIWYLDAPTDLSSGTLRVVGQGTWTSADWCVTIYEYDDEADSGASGQVATANGTSTTMTSTMSTGDGDNEVVCGIAAQVTDATPFTPQGVTDTEVYDGLAGSTSVWSAYGTATGGTDTVGAEASASRRFGMVAYEVILTGSNAIPTIALDTADEALFETDEPELLFTGSDADSDDLRYNVLISDDVNFGTGDTLVDSHTTGL